MYCIAVSNHKVLGTCTFVSTCIFLSCGQHSIPNKTGLIPELGNYTITIPEEVGQDAHMIIHSTNIKASCPTE